MVGENPSRRFSCQTVIDMGTRNTFFYFLSQYLWSSFHNLWLFLPVLVPRTWEWPGLRLKVRQREREVKSAGKALILSSFFDGQAIRGKLIFGHWWWLYFPRKNALFSTALLLRVAQSPSALSLQLRQLILAVIYKQRVHTQIRSILNW